MDNIETKHTCPICRHVSLVKIPIQQNPYPKDLFRWDNKDPAIQIIDGKEKPLSQGRLNELLYTVWEYWYEKLKQLLRD